jgi:peptidoglycan/xylan/chitin deacetylase (PgdA/CDA1 family)
MKSGNLRLAAIVVCAVTVALVWGRMSMTGAGPTAGPGAPAAVRSSAEGGGGAGGAAIAGTSAASPPDGSAAVSAGNATPETRQAATTGASGAGSATLTATSTRPAGFTIRIPVFMYHRIAPDNEIGTSLPGLVVNPNRFAAQMDALQLAGWHTITARTLANDLAAGRQPPRHSFVVTLDDGHNDGYTYAYPILRRHGFVATYFVITDRIGHTGYFSVRQLKTMAAGGMEIASHTMRHADLTQLSSTGVRAQLSGSASAIGAAVGTRPITFAYPFGLWNRGLATPLAATGYRMAFIEGGTCAHVTWPSRFWVPRLRVARTMSAGGPLAGARACAG